jgi:hypothetical protein
MTLIGPIVAEKIGQQSATIRVIRIIRGPNSLELSDSEI